MSAQTSAPAVAPARIGCSGWIYKHWRGLFYPQGLAVKRWFEFQAGDSESAEVGDGSRGEHALRALLDPGIVVR